MDSVNLLEYSNELLLLLVVVVVVVGFCFYAIRMMLHLLYDRGRELGPESNFEIPSCPIANGCVLITGCDREISVGYQTAKLLSDNGWNVFAGVLNEESKRKLEEKNNITKKNKLHIVVLDIANEQQMDGVLKEIKERGFLLLSLINNAIYMRSVPFIFIDLNQEMEKNTKINLLGTFTLSQKVLQQYLSLPLETKTKFNPRIVFVSSLSVYAGGPFHGMYVMTKRATEGLAEVMRRELKAIGEQHIRVAIIQPGMIKTDTASEWKLGVEDNWKKMNTQRVPESVMGQYERVKNEAIKQHDLLVASGHSINEVARSIIHASSSSNPAHRYRPAPFAGFFIAYWCPSVVSDWVLDLARKFAR